MSEIPNINQILNMHTHMWRTLFLNYSMKV